MSKAVMFWSSGKDSATALQAAQEKVDLVALVTTVNRPENHVAVHRVPEKLLDAQAAAIGLPLAKTVIPSSCPNHEYERVVLQALRRYKEAGVDIVVFGDINLIDIRDYREALLSRAGMRGLFPLWERDTRELSEYQIDLGIRAVVTCVDNKVLSEDYAGREFDHSFVDSLPAVADPCGENGEFHTFAYDAPIYSRRIPFELIRTFDDGAFSYAIIDAPTTESNDGE